MEPWPGFWKDRAYRRLLKDSLWHETLNDTHYSSRCVGRQESSEPLVVEIIVEVPRGSFLKRGSTGRVDFISPLPCPFNYGSVPDYLGLDGDLLDALVLGPRLPFGTRIRAKAWGAVTMTDGGLIDDKLVCGDYCPDALERRKILQFFHLYAKCKGLLNVWRGRRGRNACDGWCDSSHALARARPLRRGWPGIPPAF
ncbi:inorganic pyrophosphatase [Nitrosospira briensis]|uniref:inorganic diphosphatase n=1 Tax=Nitrosospira briensis TaxID=35799 RepID=A0A1I5EP02_9PROT|nr:inorganic pyrophosphatase [Nitrosospira briensis]